MGKLKARNPKKISFTRWAFASRSYASQSVGLNSSNGSLYFPKMTQNFFLVSKKRMN